MTLFLLTLLACGSDPVAAPSPTVAPAPASPAEATAPAEVGPPDSAWVDAEVARATTHIAEQPGGALLQRAIDAHGGLRAWAAAGILAFDFDYQPSGSPRLGATAAAAST